MQDQPGDPRGELRDHERGEQVASLDRRIEALEKAYAKSTAEEHTAAERGRKELIHKAIHGALDAMAHIKRAPIERPEWRYEVEKLKDRGPFTIACHVAALAHMEHPDVERAREILEEFEAERGIEDSPLWTMIDSLVDDLNRMREECEKRGD
jgi:hypothetical protein